MVEKMLREKVSLASSNSTFRGTKDSQMVLKKPCETNKDPMHKVDWQGNMVRTANICEKIQAQIS